MGGASFFVADQDAQDAFISIYFGTVGESMVTLFQVCTLESWANGIMRPAQAIVPGLQWVFIAYVVIISIGLMNMIVGVFVEQCAATSAADAEYRRAVAEMEFCDRLAILQELFTGFDGGSADGVITIEEFAQLSKDPRFLSVLDSIPSITSASELFEALDCTGDGKLDVDEFVRGVSLCKAAPTALDVSNCLALLRKLRADQAASQQDIKTLSATVASLVDKVDLISNKLGVSPPQKNDPIRAYEI